MKKINLLYFILLFASLAACDNEDVTPNSNALPDTVNPTVKIISPTANASLLVIERVMLNVNAKDNKWIDNLKVYLSGPDSNNNPLLMAEIEKPIFGNQNLDISILLPRDISAGEYTMLVIVTDKAQNVAEDSVTISVQSPDLDNAKFAEAFEKASFLGALGWWDYGDVLNGMEFDESWLREGFFAMADTDFDSNISEAEWELFISDFDMKDQAWSKWDIDKNGLLDNDEFQVGWDALKFYSEWDTDKNALFSQKEVADGVFGRWDQNKDDLLSKEEYQEKFYRYLLR